MNLKDMKIGASLLIIAKGDNVEYDSHSTQINMPVDSRFLALQESIPKDIIYREKPQINGKDHPDESMGLESVPHITVLYGLKNDGDYDKLKEKLKKLGPIELEIGNMSSFRNDDKDNDVLIMEIKSPKLEKLHYYIKENLDNDYSFPEYKPHLTLSYVKAGAGKELEGPTDWTGTKYKAKNMIWSHKDGRSLPVSFTGK